MVINSKGGTWQKTRNNRRGKTQANGLDSIQPAISVKYKFVALFAWNASRTHRSEVKCFRLDNLSVVFRTCDGVLNKLCKSCLKNSRQIPCLSLT